MRLQQELAKKSMKISKQAGEIQALASAGATGGQEGVLAQQARQYHKLPRNDDEIATKSPLLVQEVAV